MFFGVFHHPLAAHVGVGNAHTGIEQTDKVVDLGHRPHGGTRVLVGGFLLDGDDRAEAGDAVHVGALYVAHKVAGIGREGLHIAALTFGVDGVEGQARLAAAAETGEYHKLVARDVDVHILQVMLARS